MAGLAFHNRDTKRPSQDTTVARTMHILNQRDPAPISQRATSAASSEGQNWGAPAISNHQSATAKNALRVTAKHYEPYLHKAKEKKGEVLQWQGRVKDRKDVLADTTYARYMANREPLVGQKGLEGEFFKAASEYASKRMFFDLAKHRLSAHTRAGAPAKTYAKLRVAGIRPIKKRGSAPSPARSPSAVPHRPAESHASGLLAKSALQVVADHIQWGIPAAQSQSSRAVKAFEESQRELESAAKAWRKPFIEAMYHSQQNGMEMNRRYRNNNRDQYRANQHLRTLHEALGKLRDSGISPRDLKRKRYTRSLEYTALSILTKQTNSTVPEARQHLFQTAKTATDSKKEVDLQYERHNNYGDEPPSWEMMNRHSVNTEKYQQARLHPVGLRKRLKSAVDIRPRAPAASGAEHGRYEMHPLAHDALSVVAMYNQRQVDDVEAEHAKAAAKVSETGAAIAAHVEADTLNTPAGLDLVRQQSANTRDQAHANNRRLGLYRNDAPARTLMRLRKAIKGVDNKGPNLHTHRKRSPSRYWTRSQRAEDALEVVANHSCERIMAVRAKKDLAGAETQELGKAVRTYGIKPYSQPGRAAVVCQYYAKILDVSKACQEFYALLRQGGPVRTLQKLRASCRQIRAKLPNGIVRHE